MKYHVTIEDAVQQLSVEKVQKFTILMQHGTMKVEYYVPGKVDHQTPHKQDELYIIASGNARFYRNGEYITCKKSDVLFVPAGLEHRFEEISDDFATWVIFYGIDGGEAKA